MSPSGPPQVGPARLFKRLCEVQGKVAAQEVVKELAEFLKGKNADSLKSLREAGEDLIALQSLDAVSYTHLTLPTIYSV